MQTGTLLHSIYAWHLLVAVQTSALGGANWNSTASHAHLESSHCGIDRVPARALSPTDFRNHFWERGPVILIGIENGNFAARTGRARLLADYGHLPVTLSTANTISHDKIQLELRSVLACDAPSALQNGLLPILSRSNDGDTT